MINLTNPVTDQKNSWEKRYRITQESLNLIEEVIMGNTCNISLTEYSFIKRILDESKREVSRWS